MNNDRKMARMRKTKIKSGGGGGIDGVISTAVAIHTLRLVPCARHSRRPFGNLRAGRRRSGDQKSENCETKPNRKCDNRLIIYG